MMPGFGDAFGVKHIESDEAILAKGGRPVPKEVREKMAKGGLANGIQYDRFVPSAYRIKFRRFKAAKFDFAEAELLKPLGFDILAEIEWMNRAHNYAENEYIETKRRLDAMSRGARPK